MKSNVWLRLTWTDYQLQWDESDYGGIGVLRLPPDKVWRPDIVLFNKYVYNLGFCMVFHFHFNDELHEFLRNFED